MYKELTQKIFEIIGKEQASRGQCKKKLWLNSEVEKLVAKQKNIYISSRHSQEDSEQYKVACRKSKRNVNAEKMDFGKKRLLNANSIHS